MAALHVGVQRVQGSLHPAVDALPFSSHLGHQGLQVCQGHQEDRSPLSSCSAPRGRFSHSSHPSSPDPHLLDTTVQTWETQVKIKNGSQSNVYLYLCDRWTSAHCTSFWTCNFSHNAHRHKRRPRRACSQCDNTGSLT